MSLEYLKNKKIVLTGGTGFVGQYLLKALEEVVTEHGAEVTCIVRKSSNVKALPSFVNIKEVNFISGKGLDDALSGQDVVIHLAAMLSGVFWQDYLCNVTAADLLGKAIAKHNIERVLLVSSIAATGPIAPYRDIHFAKGVTDSDTARPVSAYGWSKYLAEEMLSKHCGDKLVILRPPMIYGSGDKGLLPFFKAVSKGVIVSPGLCRDFPISVIHVSDMAQAILCGLKPEARGVYHCNDGENSYNPMYTMGGFGKAMAKVMGKKAYCVKLPLCVLGVSAAISTAYGAIMKRFNKPMPSLTFDKYRESRAVGWMCNSQRLQDELGFVPSMSLHVGLQETYTGYKRDKFL